MSLRAAHELREAFKKTQKKCDKCHTLGGGFEGFSYLELDLNFSVGAAHKNFAFVFSQLSPLALSSKF